MAYISYMNELLARMVAIEKEAMASLGVRRFDAQPYIYEQDDFPYITNRLADVSIGDNGSEVVDVATVTAVMRFVIGHTTQGIRHEPQQKLYEYLPVIKTYFNKRMWLQSLPAYPTRMAHGLTSVRVTTNGVARVLENTGTAASQIGAEIVLTCVFYQQIEQDYFADIEE